MLTRCFRVPIRTYLLVLGAVFFYAMLANSWMVDDAYITFRAISNWYDGYGPRWNVTERVQVYTHPLWMLLMSALYGLTQELFYTAMVLSYVLCGGAVWVMYRSFNTNERWRITPFVLLLMVSKAFMDYTTSGLENPLSYLLIVLFYMPYLTGRMPAQWMFRGLAGNVAYYYLVSALAFANRMDTILLFVPALAHIAYLAFRSRTPRVLSAIVLGCSPAAACVLGSLVYYGFPFPNTYYAKAASNGIPTTDIVRQGFAYFINSLAWDPPTLCLIGIALTLALTSGNAKAKFGALGLLLYLLYILRIGASGTHMSGRFFAAPYLVGVILLMARPSTWAAGMLTSLLAIALGLICPMSPLKANTGYYHSGGDGTGHGRNGIIDTRFLVQHHDGSAPFNFERTKAMPNMPWFDEGRQFRNAPERVRIGGHGPAVGFFAFAAGPHKVIIDVFGLGDPLLARLPSRAAGWYGGHFERQVPEGYEASVRSGRNQIVDPDLRAYYDKLSLVTQGPVFSTSRFKAILELNLGAADHLLEGYNSRH